MSAVEESYSDYPSRFSERAPVMIGTPERARVAPVAAVGLLTILVAVWGGIAPYVGPVFGYDPTTTTAWSWTLAHALLALVPGAVGVLAGISMLTSGSRLALGIGRFGLAVAGIVAALVGAWFVIGPSAWVVMRSASGYFLPGSATHDLLARVGVAFGPGIVLAALGGFTAGWAVRHRPVATVAGGRRGLSRTGPVEAATAPTPISGGTVPGAVE